jgi:protein TonB
MVPTLIESARRTDKHRVLGTALVSFTVHAGVIASAVVATLQVRGTDHTVKVDTTMVLLTPQQRPQAPERQPAQLDVPLKGFQVVVVPPEIPADIPPVDLHQRFDPKDYSGAGVEGGRARGVAPDDNRVYLETVVEQRPALLSGPPPYPELLRVAGIRGRVVLQAIVDTTGRLEPNSIKIVQSPHAGFGPPIRQWAATALFSPARLQGRAVRVLVRLPLDYAVSQN